MTDPKEDPERWNKEEEWRRNNCGCIGCCICVIPEDLDNESNGEAVLA